MAKEDGSEILTVVHERVARIEDSAVYFTMKKLRMRYLSVDQVCAVKIFIALRELGISVVSSSLFQSIYGTSVSNITSLLHRLGDKGVITMVKNTKPGAYRYVLSERFVALWSAPPPSINTGSRNKVNATFAHDKNEATAENRSDET